MIRITFCPLPQNTFINYNCFHTFLLMSHLTVLDNNADCKIPLWKPIFKGMMQGIISPKANFKISNCSLFFNLLI